MIVKRPFVIAYAALTVLSALMLAWPPVAIFVIIVTIGLGGLIPSVWLYVTAMIPGMLLHRSGVHWSLAALVSVTTAIALAIIPARIAAPCAAGELLELTADNFRKPLPRRPERIELIRERVGWVRKGDDPVDHAVCDEICQHLLLTRQVKTVTIVANARHGRPAVVVSYAFAAMARCPTDFDGRSARVLRWPTAATLAGLCIFPARGIGMTDGISISERKIVQNAIPAFALTTVELVRQVDVVERQKGRDTPLLRTTEVDIASASAPFLIFPYFGLLTSINGVGIEKSHLTANQQPLLALMDELGFTLGQANTNSTYGGIKTNGIRDPISKAGNDSAAQTSLCR